jgi:hypothetical protein
MGEGVNKAISSPLVGEAGACPVLDTGRGGI